MRRIDLGDDPLNTARMKRWHVIAADRRLHLVHEKTSTAWGGLEQLHSYPAAQAIDGRRLPKHSLAISSVTTMAFSALFWIGRPYSP